MMHNHGIEKLRWSGEAMSRGWILAMILLAIPGSAFSQGEEALDLPEQNVADDKQVDDEGFPELIIPDGSRDFRDVEKAQRIWWQRVIVEPALERLKKGGQAAWEVKAEKFVREAPEMLFRQQFGAKPIALAKTGRDLVAAGCDDATVMLLAGSLDIMCKIDWRFTDDCATKAIKAMEKDPSHKAVLLYYAYRLRSWSMVYGKFPKKSEEAMIKAIGAAVKMAGDGSFLENEHEQFLRHLISGAPSKFDFAKFAAHEPDLPLPQWVKQTILGISEASLAWKARGDGWANSVDKEGWEGFAEHLDKARVAFETAWELNPGSPIAPQRMISVVVAETDDHGDTPRIWFDRAIAAQCDYYPAYEAMLWANEPRWGGSHERMLAFGKSCVATERFDLDIPLAFTNACNDIAYQIGDWKKLYRRADVSKTLMELSEGFIREPTRKHELKMRQSYLALNAWLVGDFKRASEALAELGEPLHEQAVLKLISHGATENGMREEIAMRTMEGNGDYNNALAFMSAGDPETAEKILRALESKTTGLEKKGILDQLSIIQVEKELASMDWVNLPVDKTLCGWIERGGNWSGTEDGILVNKGDDNHGAIVHRARVGPDFEMRVEFSVDAKSKCCRRCDIVFGWHLGSTNPHNIASYGQGGQAPPVAWIAYNNQPSKGIKQVKIRYKDTNELLLRSKDGKLTFTVNGTIAFEEVSPKGVEPGPDDGRVGIGSYRWCRENVTRITKIQVKKL